MQSALLFKTRMLYNLIILFNLFIVEKFVVFVFLSSVPLPKHVKQSERKKIIRLTSNVNPFVHVTNCNDDMTTTHIFKSTSSCSLKKKLYPSVEFQ